MQAYFDQRQKNHDPQFRLRDGKVIPNPDRPGRVEALVAGAVAAGCQFTAPSDHGMAPLAAVHTPRYLSFLRNIHRRRSAEVADLAEVVPSRSVPPGTGHYSYVTEAQIGFHNADTSCPISDQTWMAAYWSAQTALSGADAILQGARRAYALCRPSGHHAYREQAGGFCFLNNAAIAAEHLRAAGHRPAILDVDLHHGNGTQAIFYARSDVFTLSLHCEPGDFYPYYAGDPQETGSGEGLGYNLNLALPRGAGDDAFLAALDMALDQIACFGASVIVLALGLDAHEHDPFRGLAVTTGGFSRIGAAIASSGLPVLAVQEGGYMQPALAENLTAALGGLGRQAAPADTEQ